MITQKDYEELLSYLKYKDGELYRIKPQAGVKSAMPVGNIHHSGYKRFWRGKNMFWNAKAIYFLHHKKIPKIIDHIDGNRLNNRIENLREVTTTQNNQNNYGFSHNTSGIKGVHLEKKSNKWVVQIGVNGKQKHFGKYFDKEIARFVAETMRHKYHGKFANHANQALSIKNS